MTIKWKVERWYKEPERLEVINETECFVTAKDTFFTQPRRMKKEGIYETFEAAKQAMIEGARQRIENAKCELKRAEESLSKIESLKEPEAKA